MRTAQTPSIQPLDLLSIVGRELSARTAKSAMRAAERLEKQLRQAWGLPFTAVFCVWDKRRFAIVLPPHPRWAGWKVVERWRTWDAEHQEYFRCATLRRGDILLTVEQRYVAVGDTYVFCSVITKNERI